LIPHFYKFENFNLKRNKTRDPSISPKRYIISKTPKYAYEGNIKKFFKGDFQFFFWKTFNFGNLSPRSLPGAGFSAPITGAHSRCIAWGRWRCVPKNGILGFTIASQKTIAGVYLRNRFLAMRLILIIWN